MASLAIVHERTPDGWRPVGVILGTAQRVDFKFLPGSDRVVWARNAIATTQPETTWEAQIADFAVAKSNMYDLLLTSLPNKAEPEHPVYPTLDQNYQAYVLEAKPNPLPSPAATPADAIPELGGYRKVTPVK